MDPPRVDPGRVSTVQGARASLATAASAALYSGACEPSNRGAYNLGTQDESVHPPGIELLWNESVYLDFTSPDGSLGGYAPRPVPELGSRLVLRCLVGDGRPLVMLCANTAPS